MDIERSSQPAWPEEAVLEIRRKESAGPARSKPSSAQFLMTVIVVVLGSYLVAPIAILLVMSFNVAPDMLVDAYELGLANWQRAWAEPLLLQSLRHSVLIWSCTVAISLPTAIAISWALARTDIRWSFGLEYLF